MLVGAVVGAALAVEITAIAPTCTAALGRLELADPAWAAVAVLAAAASMSFFARTRRRLMSAAGVRVRQRDALAAVFVANAVHVTLPGGAAFSTAWTCRWMRARGASSGAIAWTLVTGGVLCSSALASIGLVGSLLLGHAAGPAGLLADGLSVTLLVSAATLVQRRPDLLGASAARGARLVDRVLRRPGGQSEHAARTLLAQITAVRPRPIDWAAAAAYAVANWLLDAACLWAGGVALGVHLSLPVLLLCYAAGMAAAGLSLVPAGIGLVDGAMVLVLTAAGLPAATALPVVLLYRLISLVGVVAAGWVIAAAQTFAAPASVPSPSGERPGSDLTGRRRAPEPCTTEAVVAVV
jgi:uncharacterized membrane protein YbhN (UPF0104 family)